MANGYNQYIGMRYVPIIDGEWSQSKAYEPLVVVTYNGNSYISKTYAPAGTLPTNETYWILAANYNAQVEQYRQEVRQYQQTVDGYDTRISDVESELTTFEGTTNTRLTTAEGTIEDINTEITSIREAIIHESVILAENIQVAGESTSPLFNIPEKAGYYIASVSPVVTGSFAGVYSAIINDNYLRTLYFRNESTAAHTNSFYASVIYVKVNY